MFKVLVRFDIVGGSLSIGPDLNSLTSGKPGGGSLGLLLKDPAEFGYSTTHCL
jgi:hypothetical protein